MKITRCQRALLQYVNSYGLVSCNAVKRQAARILDCRMRVRWSTVEALEKRGLVRRVADEPRFSADWFKLALTDEGRAIVGSQLMRRYPAEAAGGCLIFLIKWKGECPMSRVKTRKSHECNECGSQIEKGDMAFRSLLDGMAGGLQRCDLICQKCGESCPHKLEL